MESGQAELIVLWRAYVDRFSGRRVGPALSFLLVVLIGAVGWTVESPTVGVIAAVALLACFVFLVALAMAHREVTASTGPPLVSSSASPTGTEPVAVGDADDEPPAADGTVTRLAG